MGYAIFGCPCQYTGMLSLFVHDAGTTRVLDVPETAMEQPTTTKTNEYD
jgi:hypothetical protein